MDELHDNPNQDCPNDADVLRIVFQGKWRLRVLQEIVKGPVRLSQLRRAVPQDVARPCSDRISRVDGCFSLESAGKLRVGDTCLR